MRILSSVLGGKSIRSSVVMASVNTMHSRVNMNKAAREKSLRKRIFMLARAGLLLFLFLRLIFATVWSGM